MSITTRAAIRQAPPAMPTPMATLVPVVRADAPAACVGDGDGEVVRVDDEVCCNVGLVVASVIVLDVLPVELLVKEDVCDEEDEEEVVAVPLDVEDCFVEAAAVVAVAAGFTFPLTSTGVLG